MDTIGYAIEEMVYLPSEMRDALGSEEPKWKKRTKVVVFTILGIIFVLFTVYQGWLTISSYRNPAWSSYKSELATTPFPGFLIPKANLIIVLRNTALSFQTGEKPRN